MENRINVAEYLRPLEDNLFIKEKGPDRVEAAQRMTITEKSFEEWHAAINRTHTSEMPTELMSLYNDAAKCMCKILAAEKMIIIHG